MKFAVPPNILYMLFCFLLMDLVNQVQILTFTTLAATINVMNNHTLKAHFGIEPTATSMSIMNSLVTSSSTLGMITSLFVLLPFSESKGRKYSVIYFRFLITLISSVCQLTSAIFEATEIFILGQFFNGTQLPLRMFVTLMYLTECAPDKYRGFASTALVFSDVIGQVIMYSLASPNVFGKSNTWFVFPLTVLICSIILFCMTVRLPESPKWLVRQNRMEEAARSVKFYHGESCNINEVLKSLIKEKNLTKESRISIRQVLENDTLREALKILMSVTLFLIIDSSTVQFVYTVFLHTSAGFTVEQTLNINLVLSVLFFPTKFIGTYIIDALGRRPVMAIAGVIIYSKTWLILATECIIYFVGPSILTQILFVAIDCLTDSITATGVNSIGILFISELFPPSARTAVGQALILVSMMINFPVMTVFPIISSFCVPIFFVPHVITQFVLGVYLYRHMPETRARAVCDIIESLDNEVASRSGSFLDEKAPLIIKDRAQTLVSKRNSILITSRSRATTFDHKLIPSKWNC